MDRLQVRYDNRAGLMAAMQGLEAVSTRRP
jgi:hypothetical protein